MDITESMQRAFNDVIVFMPKVLAFLAILLVGWFISKWLGKLVGRLLAKARLDSLGERSGLRRFTGSYEMSALFGKLVYYMLLLFVLQIAFGVFGPNPVSDLIADLVAWLPNLFIAILILVIAFAVANAVFGLIGGILSGAAWGRVLARAAQIAIIFIGAVAATGQAGIADTVTEPIMWTVLASIAGVIIVGVGGGLIGPMRERWDRMLRAAEEESAKIKSESASESDDQQ